MQERATRAEKFEGKEVLVAEEEGVGVVELDPLEDKKENSKQGGSEKSVSLLMYKNR